MDSKEVQELATTVKEEFGVEGAPGEFAAGSLVGYLPEPTFYSTLTALFGEPHTRNPEGEDGKVMAEWVIRTADGLVAIYDYKQYGAELPDVSIWHLGATVGAGADQVRQAVEAFSREVA